MKETFTNNVLIIFITRVFAAVFTVIITIIIARGLGPEKQGIYSLATLLSLTLLTFTVFGVNVSTVFYIGKKKYPPEVIFGNNIIFSALLSVLTLALGLAAVYFWGDRLFPGVDRAYLLLALSIVPVNLFFSLASSVLIGLQEIRKYSLISFLQVLFFLLFAVVLIPFLHLGIKAAILSQTLSYLVAGAVLFFMVKKETQRISLKFNKDYFIDAIVYGFKNYIGGVLNYLHYRADMFLINVFMNPLAVGFYYVAVRMSEGIWLFSQSSSTILFPRVASETDPKKLKDLTPLVCRNTLFVTFLIAAVLFALSHWLIVLFYSQEFAVSVRPFQILLIGTVAMSGWIILINDLAARGAPMINNYVMGISLLANIVLNIVYIPRLGIDGSAWSSTVSYTISLIATAIIYGRISGNKFTDIVFVKKSDFRYYKAPIAMVLNKLNIKFNG